MKQKSTITSTRQFRVLTRDMARYPADRQLRDCEAHAEGVEIVTFNADKDRERNDWFKLARPGDALAVADVRLIHHPRGVGTPSPAADLQYVVAEIGVRRLRLIEGRTGITNASKNWPARIRDACTSVNRGRRFTVAEAQAGGRKRGEQMTKASVRRFWQNHPDRELYQAVWMNTGLHRNKDAAMEAVNKMAAKARLPLFDSVSTIERAFGYRTTGKLRSEAEE